jgi:hypothetical protein
LALSDDINETVGFWTLGDFRRDMGTVSGRVALVHRLCVRLQTSRGRFPWWPRFGTDLREYLGSKARSSVIAGAAVAECEKDEQVDRCEASGEYVDNGRGIRLPITVFDSDGPFQFTLLVEQAKLTLIELQATV